MVRLEPFLLSLAERIGGGGLYFEATTSEFGKVFGVSQQSASRYLGLLEDRGFILRARSRRGVKVTFTEEGLKALRGMEKALTMFLSNKPKTAYRGEVVSGIGEGAYYVRKYAEKIHELLGYKPYPGTLNIRVYGGKPDVVSDSTVEVQGFVSEKRSFGGVGLTPITLKVKGRKITCHVILPERTHHRRDLELISRYNIRKKYGVSDGDEAEITWA